VFEKKANDVSGQLESLAKESSAKIYELEVRLRHKEEDERHLIEEKRHLEDKVMELEAQISSHEENITQTKSRIVLLEPLVESMKTDLQRAADSEEKLKEELSSQRASNHIFVEQLSQLQSEKDGIVAQLDNSHKEFAELTERLSEEKKQLQSQVLHQNTWTFCFRLKCNLFQNCPILILYFLFIRSESLRKKKVVSPRSWEKKQMS
jgi:chromosome segregation ATPase